MTPRSTRPEAPPTRHHSLPSPDGMLTRGQVDRLRQQRRQRRITAAVVASVAAIGVGGAAYASGMLPGSSETPAPKVSRDFTPAIPGANSNSSIDGQPPVALSSDQPRAEIRPRASKRKKTSPKNTNVAAKPAQSVALTTEIAARPKTLHSGERSSHKTSKTSAHAERPAVAATQPDTSPAEPLGEPPLTQNNAAETAAEQQALQQWIQQEQAKNPSPTPATPAQKPSYCDLPNGFNDPQCQ